MLSLLRITGTPVALKSSPPSHQFSPYSPFCKRATFAAVLAGASSPPAGGHRTPLAICHLEGLDSVIARTQRLLLSTRPLAVCKSNSAAANNDIANPDTTLYPTTGHLGLTTNAYHCSTFPVYGPFDLLYCIQTGGFGAAWAARDHSTGRLLCLKVFQSLQDPDVSRSVRAELRAFRRMAKSERGDKGRQFIMELNRSMQHGDDVFFAMELMSADLGTHLTTEPDRCKMHARRWMAQIALGIKSLHDMEIIHRDIKAENILIDCRENIRIIDFGLAYLTTPNVTPRAVEFLGTPPYMAPEVLRNKGLPTNQRMYYGMAIDWWALGCILFELESRDHQLLFNTEEDVHAYVAWTRKPCQHEQIYPGFEALDPVVVDLLEGLLQVAPSTRYSLTDMEKHAYFLHRDGTNEFDNAAARALERPVCPELVPLSAGGNGPIKVVEAAKLVTPNDWTNLKWALVSA